MAAPQDDPKKTVSVTYTLFLIGIALQAAMVAGVLVAHGKKAEVTDPVLAGHLRHLILTFWIAAPVVAVAAYLVFEMDIRGAAWAGLIWPWVIWRVVRGAVRFWKNQPI